MYCWSGPYACTARGRGGSSPCGGFGKAWLSDNKVLRPVGGQAREPRVDTVNPSFGKACGYVMVNARWGAACHETGRTSLVDAPGGLMCLEPLVHFGRRNVEVAANDAARLVM